MNIIDKITCIGVDSGSGAQNKGTKDGPSFMYKNLTCVQQSFLERGIEFLCEEIIYPKKLSIELGSTDFRQQEKNMIIDVCQQLTYKVVDCIMNQKFPLVIGGDHSVALGTWFGVATAYSCYSELGIIWIDAHMDSHTFETSISKAIHGMPLALLMGYGDTIILSQVLQNQRVISPNHIVLIGTRSFEEGEAKLLQKLGVKIYYIEDVIKYGFRNVFFESVSYLQSKTKNIGVSLDLDVFDPNYVAGTASKEPNGVLPSDFLDVMKSFSFLKEFVGFEIMEYNPYLDENLSTCSFVKEIISHLK